MTLATDDAARDVLRGEWLLKGLLSHVWEPFGFGSFFEYVERLFGYSPHQTSERIRVARALAELPAMRETLREGRINWSVVREATRVVVPETEAEWLVALAGKTVREVERMVSGRSKGDGPNDPPDPRPERKVLRFEVNAETRALIAEARTQIVRDAGHHLSDDDVLQLMARAVLGTTHRSHVGSEKSAGESNYQIHLTVCPKCQAGDQRAGGEEVRVRPEVVEAAQCDALVVGVPRGTTSGDTDATDDTHASRGSVPRGTVPKEERAGRTIPPATRRAVVQRDKARCSVPGCRHHQHIDAHHLLMHSHGGSNDMENLTLLCGVHHIAVHDGRLVITGRPSTGLKFFHANGGRYGFFRPPRSRTSASPPTETAPSPAFEQARKTLKALGFRNDQVAETLAKLQTTPAPDLGDTPNYETIVRVALGDLRSGALVCREPANGYIVDDRAVRPTWAAQRRSG